MAISDNLTYAEAQAIAIEEMKIKNHDCIFVEFDNAFGYSILVFYNGLHIYHADDYELHHSYLVKEKGKEALRQFYIEKMNQILFTDAELLEDVKTYDEYQRKMYFLRNYYIMRFDYLTIFRIGKKQEEEFEKEKPKYPYMNPVSFCYVKDENIVKKQKKYCAHLKASFKVLKENENTFREMVRTELANHEACITCDYTEALNALGLTFENLSNEKQKIVKEELKKQINNYCS